MPRIALTVEELKLRPRGTKSQAKPYSPEIEAGRPRAPKHLCSDALVEFKRVSKILGKRKTETAGDFATLAVYSEVYSRWVAAKKLLAAEGLQIDVTVLDSNGAPHTNRKLNPLIGVVERCERNVLALASAMGLTPATREKVKPARHTEPPKPLTPEEQMFADLDNRKAFRIAGQENPS